MNRLSRKQSKDFFSMVYFFMVYLYICKKQAVQ